MAIVTTDSKHYSNIASAIREKTGDETTYTPEEIPVGIDEVYEAGKQEGIQSEYDRFWDAFQGYGSRTSYKCVFQGMTRLADFFYPKYDIIPIQCVDIFRGTAGWAWGTPDYIFDLSQRLKDCGVKFDTSKASSLQGLFLFSSVTSVPTISFEGVTDANYGMHSVFRGNRFLKTIEKIIPHATIGFFNTTFEDCPALENITFDNIGVNGLNLSQSPLLTHDSLMSIINALQDKSADTSGTTWAVTLGETNLAKLTDTEKAIATQKGWTLA